MKKYNELCNNKDHLVEDSDSVNELQSYSDKAGAMEEYEAKTENSPDDFSTNDYAAKRGIAYVDAYLLIKAGLINKTVIFVREERRAAKGKLTKIYREIKS
jgi:hypothetical protein